MAFGLIPANPEISLLFCVLWPFVHTPCFSDDFFGVFVVSHGDELGMTEVIGTRPFEKINPDDSLWSYPNAMKWALSGVAESEGLESNRTVLIRLACRIMCCNCLDPPAKCDISAS